MRTRPSAIPDLRIEIVSRNRASDGVAKRLAHAETGVRECWTVVARPAFVERWTGPGLAAREELRESLVTRLLPGFRLDVAELMKEP